MTYSYLKPRLAKLIPELANNETALRLALPAAIGATTGLGALAYNAVAPLDVDPIGLAVGTGLALGTQGRTPYNYAGIAALGLEGARYLNNAFTNTRDTEASPLIAMGIGAGSLGLREALRRGVIRYDDVGFPTTGRMAQDLGKPSATTPIDDVVAAPPRPPKQPPPKPTKPRVATDSTEAPINPNTGNVSVVVPSNPNLYLARNLGVMSPRLTKQGIENLGDYASESPQRKAQLSYDSPIDYFDNLVDPEDLFKEYGLNTVVVNPSRMLVDRRLLENRLDLLNQPVVQIVPSTLDTEHSELVKRGLAKAGQPHPNVRAYGVETINELGRGPDTTPSPSNPFGYYNKAKEWEWDSNVDPRVAKAVIDANGGRIAVNLNNMKPLDTVEQNDLYLDALGLTGIGAYTPIAPSIPKQTYYPQYNKDYTVSKRPMRIAIQGDN